MSEDPALLANQQAQAELAAQVAYQNALLHGQDETRALNAAIAAADNQLKALGMVTSLQGPRNAFQQQAMEVGLNNAGYSNAFNALAGQYNLPAFGRQFAPAQPMSMGTIAADMGQAGGNTGAIDPVTQVMNQLFAGLGWTTQPSTSTSGSTGSTTSGTTSTPTVSSTPSTTSTSSTPTQATASGGSVPIVPIVPPPTDTSSYEPNSAQADNMLASLPSPNKIDVRQWNQMSPDTQQFLLGAYSSAGYSPNDVQNTIGQIAPQFRAPKFGAVAGG